tara:strand:- start:1416 stop:1622 length:207 start_codon:yes stop_codon:yes gene_type:complete
MNGQKIIYWSSTAILLSIMLVEWAYAGLFFYFSLAALLHCYDQDGNFGRNIVALVLFFISFFLKNKVR